eukprot:TRINITY_DN44197_c0_g1_i1.p1 TRINITY_DN44197_c0_g1~~TRINITY_DN44197_c0_g1_i1.p1  ORF type:complete len:487 (+),score=91.87 TRINITY_DN44197_c0_g1_i1:85-1461(+)
MLDAGVALGMGSVVPPRISFHQKMLHSLIHRMETDTGVERLMDQQHVGNAELDRRVAELHKLQESIDSLTTGTISPHDRLPYPHEIPLATAAFSNAELNIMAMQASLEDSHRAQVVSEQLRVVNREIQAAEMEIARLRAVLAQAARSDEDKDQKISALEEQLRQDRERFEVTTAEKEEALAIQRREHDEDVARFNAHSDEMMKQIDLIRAELLAAEMQERQLAEERNLQREQNASQAEQVYALEAEDVRDKIALKRQLDVADQLDVDRAIEAENNGVKRQQLDAVETHARDNSRRFEELLKDLERRVAQLDSERARERWIHELKVKELGSLVQQSTTQSQTFRTQASDASRAIDALQQAVRDETMMGQRLEQQRDLERHDRQREASDMMARIADADRRLALLQQQRDVAQSLLDRQRLDVQSLSVNDAISAASISQALLEARQRYPVPGHADPTRPQR